MSSFHPAPGTYETTAAYSLVIAIVGTLLLTWWWPMAVLYGASAVAVGRFAQRRIHTYDLTGQRSARAGRAIGVAVIAFVTLASLVDMIVV